MRVLSAPDAARRVEAAAVRLLALVALLIVTLVLFTDLPRYRAVGPELLRNPRFETGLDDWTAGRGVALDGKVPGTAVLTNRDPDRQVTLEQPVALPARPIKLRLSGEVAIGGVVPGPMPWHRARLFLVSRDEDGRYLWARRHNLMLLSGSSGWRRFSGIYDIPADIPMVVMAANISGATGTMWVRDLSLVEVDERAEFRLARSALIALWAVALGWIGLSLWRAVESGPRRLVLAATALAMGGMALLPETVRTGAIVIVAGGPPAERVEDIALVGHFLAFAAVAIAARVIWPALPPWLHLLGLALLAALTELAQFFIPSRTPEVVDWLANTAGALAGLALVGLARRLQRTLLGGRRTRPFQQRSGDHRTEGLSPPAGSAP